MSRVNIRRDPESVVNQAMNQFVRQRHEVADIVHDPDYQRLPPNLQRLKRVGSGLDFAQVCESNSCFSTRFSRCSQEMLDCVFFDEILTAYDSLRKPLNDIFKPVKTGKMRYKITSTMKKARGLKYFFLSPLQ